MARRDAGFKYRHDGYVFDQMNGAQSEYPAFLINIHGIRSKADAEAYVSRLRGIGAALDQDIATSEARELHALLLALLHSGDDGRLRAALSTVLVGVDAGGIDALERDADAHRDWQQHAVAWRERLLRGGPLALVGDVCAANADRLLGLLDGERRMSNYLQLAERLQEA